MEMLHLKEMGPRQRTYGTIAGNGAFMPSPTRQFAVHQVKGDETLAGLALKYDLTVEDLRRCNNLWANDNVWTGQVLRIPVATASSSSNESPSASSSSSSSSSSTTTSGTTSSSSTSGSLHSPPPRRKSSAKPEAAVAAASDQTIEEYLNRLDKSIAMQKKATTDWAKKRPSEQGHSSAAAAAAAASPANRRQASYSKDPAVC